MNPFFLVSVQAPNSFFAIIYFIVFFFIIIIILKQAPFNVMKAHKHLKNKFFWSSIN